MEKVNENIVMIGTVVFLVSLFLVGGLMTRNVDVSNSINDKISVNM
jgi:hypothetical protein